MALFNSGSLSPQQIITTTQGRLANLRRALISDDGIDPLYLWLSAQSDTDLVTGIGFNATDLGTLRSAVADAHAFVALYETGQLPGTYTLPYVFGASQRLVLGPST